MRFIGKSFFVLLLLFTTTVEAGQSPLSHAVARTSAIDASWRAALLELPPLHSIAPPEGDSTCNISRLHPFSQTELAIVSAAVRHISCPLLDGLKEIVIYDDSDKPRAMASATALHLRSDFFTLPEAEKVLVHELGHIVDLSGLKSAEYREQSGFFDGNLPIFADDPSVRFYALSWQDSKTQHANGRREDFVTGYAMTDPFEDFAESLLLYREHGNTFRAYAETNPVLSAKYDFLKTEVFAGTEFATGQIPADTKKREWDATKL